MDVTLSPEFEKLVHEKLEAGEYQSADEVLNAAMQLFKEREEDRAVLRQTNLGEPLPADERFASRLEMLLSEAEESGPPVEMTEQDWGDVRRAGLARINRQKPT
jgi:putative addiction module CopG family antidote